MARKQKTGIDYFSHDVHCITDRKLRLLKAKHGVIGYGIYFLLLEEIYKEGYCLQLNDEFDILFISEHNLDENVYINCLNDCINFSLFDKEIFEKFKTLTSKRVQENYIEAVSRRKGVIIDVNILMINVDNLPKNVNISTQSKVKESKLKETKVKESSSKEDTPPKKTKFVPDISECDKARKPLLEKWLKYKIEKKSPYKTQTGIDTIIKKLSKYSIDDIAYVMDLSIENEYQGLIWDKLNNGFNNNQPQQTKLVTLPENQSEIDKFAATLGD